MKTQSILILLFVAFQASLLSCRKDGFPINKNDPFSKQEKLSADTITVSGYLEKLEVSTWQYGTHILNSDGVSIPETSHFFALYSDNTITLNNFLKKYVVIQGILVEGYPVDGGPYFVKVIKIKE